MKFSTSKILILTGILVIVTSAVASFLLTRNHKISQIKHKNFKTLPKFSSDKYSSKLNGQVIAVKEVIDGDTFKIVTGEKVRLIGVDTPELHHPKKPVQCFGKDAMLATKKLIEGKTVRLEKDISDTDMYGRLLRYVYVPSSPAEFSKENSEIFLNAYLVEEGYARLETFPPDVKKAELFSHLQHQAFVSRKGLWKWCQ